MAWNGWEKGYMEGDFFSGWRDPQGHHANKTGKFLYLGEKQLQKT